MRVAASAPVAVALIGLVAVQGCARLVVVPPVDLARLNDADWSIQQRQPKRLPPGVPPTVEKAPATAVVEGPPPPSLLPGVKLKPPALGTPRDEHGIPVGLYEQDPTLRAYRQMAEARASSHRAVGGGLLAMGTLFVVMCGFLTLLAAQREQNHPEQSGSASDVYLWSILGGALGLGYIGGGIAELATRTDTRALQRYARETYDLPPAP